MPISRRPRTMRTAISPRFAISTLRSFFLGTGGVMECASYQGRCGRCGEARRCCILAGRRVPHARSRGSDVAPRRREAPPDMRLAGLLAAALALLPGAPPAPAPARPAAPPPLTTGELAAQAVAAVAKTIGTPRIPGLEKPVTVLRDAWGIAHIFAETQSDLFMAQGYVAAQDRLWQLEIWRRAGTGTLAEILGPAAI